jgi:MYXO-CTERM domain-containing protein
MRVSICLLILATCAASAQAEDPYWVEPMREVRSNYFGTDRTIARFGDSISVSMAYFTPLRYGHSDTTPEDQAALSWIQGYVTGACWDWQIDTVCDRHGCQGGTTSSWPLSSSSGWPGALPGERKVDYWLAHDNAAMAVIMWGTNDLSSGLTPAQYQSNLQQVVQACKANGTIPILTTAPPRHNYDNGSPANQQRAADFAQAARDVALLELVPLIEYHDECTTRHPHNPPTDTWDGADPMWRPYSGYQVPTMIAEDGVHPSNWDPGRSNFGDGLNTNGFNLRNWLTLHMCYDVYNAVIADMPPQLRVDLSHEVKYLGDGKYGVTFSVDANDGQPSLFDVEMTFEGSNGGQIQQVLAFGSVPVNTDTDAAIFDSIPEANYDMNLDSYFLQPFPSDPDGRMWEFENFFKIRASADDVYEHIELAYIVTDGDVSCTGVIGRASEQYDISATAVMPKPGDANRDGAVDGLDYNNWSIYYQQPGGGWAGGDFNGDGITDGLDYNIWSLFYEGEGSQTVPEPAGLALLAAGGLALLRRRRAPDRSA